MSSPVKIVDRTILALDVSTRKEAEAFVQKLKGLVPYFKVGSHLFTAEGPDMIRMIHDQGGKVFLDLKFHDIPNTVAKACEVAAKYNVFLVDVHTSGGLEMMKAAVQAVRTHSSETKVIGVTVLTSDAETESTTTRVIERARLAHEAGLDGVVCSGHELSSVYQNLPTSFITVVPGIRFSGQTTKDDQKRVKSPEEALQDGAHYLVIGRPILQAKDPATFIQSHLLTEV